MSSLSREVSQHFNQVHVAGYSHLCQHIYFSPLYFAFAHVLMLLLAIFPPRFTEITVNVKVTNDAVFLLTLLC